ncbi:MAG: FliG C-terminal domain-containing protein [Planctomycetota bacterium]|jgi:flagellar motor switch protein FliG
MALAGRQKALLLLTSLDAASASELLKGLGPDKIQMIAVELAQLDASGHRDAAEQTKVVREFCSALKGNMAQALNIKSFISNVLSSTLDEEQAAKVQSQIQRAIGRRDPFAAIRMAGTEELVMALEGEHPQTIAVVLSELNPHKSQEVLSLLDDQTRLKAVSKVVNQDLLGAGVRERMASMVSARLESLEGETLVARPGSREQNLRKLALMLSGLEREIRDQMLEEIEKHDEETGKTVRNLMVTWEDIPSIADRSLQEALRSVEAGKLAMALYGAEEELVQRIRANISERMAAMLDEEASLMQEPLDTEVSEAREEVVAPLRKANEEGTLRFVQR